MIRSFLYKNFQINTNLIKMYLPSIFYLQNAINLAVPLVSHVHSYHIFTRLLHLCTLLHFYYFYTFIHFISFMTGLLHVSTFFTFMTLLYTTCILFFTFMTGLLHVSTLLHLWLDYYMYSLYYIYDWTTTFIHSWVISHGKYNPLCSSVEYSLHLIKILTLK